ncbi:MAG: hypothetical protein K6U03_02935 [Firmicutes bacterium]|nr:hypothetical protein [Bacillota bacterium]
MLLSAQPVVEIDETSSWLTARPKALKAVRRILGKSDYEAHAGAYTGGANAVYWVEIVLERPDGLVVVKNLTEGAKIKVDEVTEPIERDLIYPLLRGRDVKRWYAEPSAYIIVPRYPGSREKAIPVDEFQRSYPCTYGYLKRFEEVLRLRKDAVLRRSMKAGTPFYAIAAVSDYTFTPWKVVWRYIASDFIVAVTEPYNGKPIVPNEKLMLVACLSQKEAHFLCAVLNSSPIRFGVRGFFVETQIAPHVIERFRIPRYDENNPIHRRLAELSEQAHEAARAGGEGRLREIEAEIDREAARLWGLSEAELRVIRRSLQELGGAEFEETEERDESASEPAE